MEYNSRRIEGCFASHYSSFSYYSLHSYVSFCSLYYNYMFHCAYIYVRTRSLLSLAITTTTGKTEEQFSRGKWRVLVVWLAKRSDGGSSSSRSRSKEWGTCGKCIGVIRGDHVCREGREKEGFCTQSKGFNQRKAIWKVSWLRTSHILSCPFQQ